MALRTRRKLVVPPIAAVCAVLFFVVAPFAWFVLLAPLFGWGYGKRRPNRVILPDGYVGWARLYYEVPGAPHLPKEDGRFLVRIPYSGVVWTSDPVPEGWATDEYFYQTDKGRVPLKDTEPQDPRGMVRDSYFAKGIFSKAALDGGFQDQVFILFVGTRKQYDRLARTTNPGDRNPLHGALKERDRRDAERLSYRR